MTGASAQTPEDAEAIYKTRCATCHEAGVSRAPGQKTWTWKLPPLLAGAHSVQVQACTAGGAACSDGAVLRFLFVALVNPKNLRLGSGGGD